MVDATEYVEKKAHPGGLKKLLSTNDAGVGASGDPFGFLSFCFFWRPTVVGRMHGPEVHGVPCAHPFNRL